MLHAESRGFSLVSHISNTNKGIQLKDIPDRNHGKINSLHVYVCAEKRKEAILHTDKIN
jgi:hypothetical protein